MYEDQTYENILDRSLARVASDVDKREGSVIMNAIAPVSAEHADVYIQLGNIVNNGYADTAVREFLILRCKERGIIPYEASGIAPIGHTVTVVSAVGKTVSINSRITLNDGYQWSQVKPKAEETLEAYFLEMRKNWEKGNLVVRISQIENRLLNLDGILDVADTQLNNVASNLALAQEEIPLLGGVYIG